MSSSTVDHHTPLHTLLCNSSNFTVLVLTAVGLQLRIPPCSYGVSSCKLFWRLNDLSFNEIPDIWEILVFEKYEILVEKQFYFWFLHHLWFWLFIRPEKRRFILVRGFSDLHQVVFSISALHVLFEMRPNWSSLQESGSTFCNGIGVWQPCRLSAIDDLIAKWVLPKFGVKHQNLTNVTHPSRSAALPSFRRTSMMDQPLSTG